LQDIVRPGRVRRVVEGNLVSEWLNIHRRAASGRTIEEDDNQMLSVEMRESAKFSARVDLHSSEVPEWMRYPPGAPGSSKNITAPIDWAAGQLVERHKLPWHTLTAVTTFILTQDHSWIEGLELLPIDISQSKDPPGDPRAFNISIRNMDEFTTKKDWDRVWKMYVRPRQEFLWEQRGMSPQGRRARDITALEKALPFYHKMVEANLNFRDLYQSEIFAGETTYDMEVENLRRAVHDLENLLIPRS